MRSKHSSCKITLASTKDVDITQLKWRK